jgi:hypothetical protein
MLSVEGSMNTPVLSTLQAKSTESAKSENLKLKPAMVRCDPVPKEPPSWLPMETKEPPTTSNTNGKMLQDIMMSENATGLIRTISAPKVSILEEISMASTYSGSFGLTYKREAERQIAEAKRRGPIFKNMGWRASLTQH